jgi:hypothetical protein
LFWCQIDDKIEGRLDCFGARLTHVVSSTLCEVTAVSPRTTLALRESCSDEERLILVQALAENEGLVTLDLEYNHITDEMWFALCPKLEKIILPQYRSTWRDGISTDAQKTLRMQAMVDALRGNTVLHTITPLDRVDFDEETLDINCIPSPLGQQVQAAGWCYHRSGRVRCVTSCSDGLWPLYPVTPL